MPARPWETASQTEIEYSLIGSWINCVLLAVEILVSWLYISKCQGQLRGPTKWVVSAMLCNDIMHSTVIWITVYMNIIPQPATSHKSWSSPITITSTFLASSIEQAFLAHRLFSLCRSLTYPLIISFLWAVRAVFSSMGIAGVILGSKIRVVSPSISFKVALGLSTLVDICLTVGIAYMTSQWQTLFKPTRSLLRRIAKNAVISGLITSLASTLLLISQLHPQSAPVFVTSYTCIGRVYSLTIVISLWVLKIRAEAEDSSTENPPREDFSTLHFHNFRSRFTGEVARTASFPEVSGSKVAVG